MTRPSVLTRDHGLRQMILLPCLGDQLVRAVLPARHAGLLPRKNDCLLNRTGQVVALDLDGLDSLGNTFKKQDYLVFVHDAYFTIIAAPGVESSPKRAVENFFVRIPMRIRLA